MGNEKSVSENRPVTAWDKVHALALCVLAVLGIVIFVGPYVERLFVQGGGQGAQQPVLVSPWGRPPVAPHEGQQVVCAMPPTFEELSKAFVCVCPKAGVGPCGSGVLIGTRPGADQKIWLVTARHVAHDCITLGGVDHVTFVMHRPNEATDYRKTFDGDGHTKWGFATNGSDLAVFDVTQPFRTSRNEGVDVKYIPLQTVPVALDDPAAVAGGFMIHRGEFAKYRLGVGSEVGVLGYAGELWTALKGKDRQPMAFRSGHIAMRNDELKVLTRGGAPIYIIESDLHPGYSGGPVFAYYEVNGLKYPALIGIVQAVIASKGKLQIDSEVGTVEQTCFPSGFAAIAPLDDLLSDGK